MTLTSGARIGPYEIVSPLGAGGMGEVYRARDSKLQRDVAIKVLPAHLAEDRERLARFQREAQLLAALNHPHIAHIYGLEESGPAHALVLELIEGETLAERISRGPVPLDEALPIARQIALALEAAHDQGIVHRDLKPANIKVTPAGVVKVLDFGLARLNESAGAAGATSLSMSPTITSPAMTGAGVILGTAAYMSPEQARGKTVDRRADIWAFGCVLFEMLSGHRLFEAGDTISDVVAAILKNDLDWSLLPGDVPPAVRRTLRRSLQKDPQKRLPHVGLVRIELEEMEDAVDPPSSPQTPARRRAIPMAAAAIVAGALVGAAMWTLRPSPPPARVLHFPIPIPEGDAAVRRLAISPDGTRVAFVAGSRLYVRSLSEPDARPVPGSEVPQGYVGEPVFSADGESLTYWTGTTANGILKRIAVRGGAPLTLYEGSFPMGTAPEGDALVFGQFDAGGVAQIVRLRSDGSRPEAIVTGAPGQIMSGPQILPGGDAVLFTLARNPGLLDLTQETWDRAQVVVQRLGSGERTVIVEGGSDARYLPTGHLVYAIGSTLFAVPFDLQRMEKKGTAIPVLTGVARTIFGRNDLGGLQFTVTNDGTMAYLPGANSSDSRRLALIDRQSGKVTPLNVPAGRHEHPRVSPDGKRIAVGIAAGVSDANVWIYELAGATEMRQLTFEGRNRNPVWSPDGTRIAFQSNRDGDFGVFSQLADGSAPAVRLTKPEKGTAHVPGSWAKNGTLLLTVEPLVAGGPSSTRAIWALRDGKLEPFGGAVTNAIFAMAPVFSPDGKWVAYTATSTPQDGLFATWVIPASGGTKQRVGEGIHPLWSPDGMELFVQEISRFVGRRVFTAPSLAFGNPSPLPNVRLRVIGINVERNYDILPDGRFLGVVGEAEASGRQQAATLAPQVQVVVNWFEELRRIAPAK